MGLTKGVIASQAINCLPITKCSYGTNVTLSMQATVVIDNLHKQNYNPNMIPRKVENNIHKLSKGFPVVTISGPRQSGKTPLVKTCFPLKSCMTLKNPDMLEQTLDAPKGFLKNYCRFLMKRSGGKHSQVIVNALCRQCRLETLMLPAVPTGLTILSTVPTDESVGYFRLSLRDKMHIYKKVGMHPIRSRAAELSHLDKRIFKWNRD